MSKLKTFMSKIWFYNIILHLQENFDHDFAY